MCDPDVSSDLRQLSHGQIIARNFSRFDINGFRFRTATLLETHPLAATSNSGVLITAADANEKSLITMVFFKT